MRASMKWRFIFAVASPSPPFFLLWWCGLVMKRLQWIRSGSWHSQHGCPRDKPIAHSRSILCDLGNHKMGSVFRYQAICPINFLSVDGVYCLLLRTGIVCSDPVQIVDVCMHLMCPFCSVYRDLNKRPIIQTHTNEFQETGKIEAWGIIDL